MLFRLYTKSFMNPTITGLNRNSSTLNRFSLTLFYMMYITSSIIAVAINKKT